MRVEDRRAARVFQPLVGTSLRLIRSPDIQRVELFRIVSRSKREHVFEVVANARQTPYYSQPAARRPSTVTRGLTIISSRPRRKPHK